MQKGASVLYEGEHCQISIMSPSAGVVIVRIFGSDVGEFGSAPLSHLKEYFLEDEKIRLYIDARHARAASVDVSNIWAQWLGKYQSKFDHISMLTGSKYIQVAAGFVRSFSSLEDIMSIYTESHAFDRALEATL